MATAGGPVSDMKEMQTGGGGLESNCPKSAALVRGVSAEGVADSLSVNIFSLDAMFSRVTSLFRQNH